MDILQSEKKLKEMPFKIPEGYFSSLEDRMARMASENAVRNATVRRPLYFRIVQAAAAAAMLSAVVLGSITLARDASDARMARQMADDSFFYLELMPATGTADILYDSDSYGYVADTGLSDEDIIDYLIYSGTPVELLNESDYE